MLKQFIVGILSSAVAHRLFPPPTNNGKSRGGGCILRLVAILIFIGLLCWAIGYGIVVAPTYTLLTLYAGLKYLAANGFIALDKLFYPGFEAPAPLVWGGWGLIGGSALQAYREMRSSGRSGRAILAILAPLLLLGFNNIIKGAEKPDTTAPATLTVSQENTPASAGPFTPVPAKQNTITSETKSSLPTRPTQPTRVRTTRNTVTTPTTKAPKPATPSVPLGMVHIPVGEFQMGSEDNDDEKPVHTVYVNAFYMDKYEVTNAQYKGFVDANPHWRKDQIPSIYHDGDYLKHWNGNNYPPDKGEHPVIYVSWYAAMAYAKWAGKRLPTEAEWEKAARGGLVGKKYPWGDSIHSTQANYNKKVDDTTSVGKYAPNAYGLYDMAGNVAEWCLDAYDADFYMNSSRQNPIAGGSLLSLTTNPTKATAARVLRGGSWSVLPQSVRVADRAKGPLTLSYFGAGFRCVKGVTSSGGN